MNAGPTALRLGFAGLPAAAEELMIARDLLLNARIGAAAITCSTSALPARSNW